MRSRPPVRFLVVLVAVLTVAGACTNGAAVNNFAIVGPPRALPTEQLAAVDATSCQQILVGLRGKPVLINIWASWCVPCRAEAPILRGAADETAGKVVFLGIDAKDDVGAARKFMSEFSISYPNLFDEGGEIPQLVGLRGYPTTVAIDRAGKIRGSSSGGLTENRLAALLAEIR